MSGCDIALSFVIVSALSVSVSAAARDKTWSLSQMLYLWFEVRPVILFILLVKVHVESEKVQS